MVLGFRDLSVYREPGAAYYGATIGRYANRIGCARFTLNGKLYELSANDGAQQLHGGLGGFHSLPWEIIEETEQSILMRYLSPHGEQGYPGNLEVYVKYELKDDSMTITYEATTDEPTFVNLTNHAYFNLNGAGSSSILGHRLYINADQFLPVTPQLIPTGDIEAVYRTPFDFRESTRIGEYVQNHCSQLRNGKGYDHCFVLNKKVNDVLTLAAEVQGDTSGITMQVFTTEPGMQFYSGNFMNGQNILKENIKDTYRSAFCLETQHFPDSPHHDHFPSTLLLPGEKYSSTTRYCFTAGDVPQWRLE